MANGRRRAKWMSIVCLGLLVASCGPQPTPTITVRLVTAAASPGSTPTAAAYPGPQTQPPGSAATTGAYPGPQPQPPVVVVTPAPYPGPLPSPTSPPQPFVFTVPTPTSQTGVVKGQTLDTTGKPYIGAIYVGRAIYSTQATAEPIISFSDQDPMATQDPATGNFAIGQVAPGKYALVLWTPVAKTVVTDPKTGANLIFEVTAGQTTDLGVVTIP